MEVGNVVHLNTPRLIANSMQKTVRRWGQQEPFGNNPAGDDADGDTIVTTYHTSRIGRTWRSA